MIDIQINGQTYQVLEGASIIEAADEHGIYIPRFCYHKKLSVAANCRMCLVEVANMKKPMPACSTPVSPDMVIFTQSEKALEAQRSVMEFLLINHPLDCPVCDQGGACELQDLSIGFGCSESDFGGDKRAVDKLELGPLLQTYMTRCIQCTRCIRFSRELGGLSELGMIDRGGGEKVSTYVERDLQSELSGNMIDVCPVGALTAKPSRFAGRSWEYVEHEGVAAHDCLGSNMYWHSSQHDNVETREVMRVVPKENESINECWISDRDRFSFEGLTHESRLLSPMVKHNGTWKEASWEAALSECADKLGSLIDSNGGDCLGVLAGPQTTMEEGFLLQKLTRALGSKHIDSRLREQDFSDQACRLPSPRLGCQIADLDSLDTLFFFGCDVRTQHPVLTTRINPSIEEGLSVCAMNPMDYAYTFPLTEQVVAGPSALLQQLAALVALVAKEKGESAVISAEKPSAQTQAIAKRLLNSEKIALLMGEHALASTHASAFRSLLSQLATLVGASFGELPYGANTVGLQYVGCVPHRQADGMALAEPGLDIVGMMEQPRRAYVLCQLEPESDVLQAAKTLKTLDEAALVICLTAFESDAMRQYADIMLPVAPPSETSGQFMNIEGSIQSFQAVTVPHGDARPAWKVLRVLANFLKLDHFEYRSLEAVRNDLSVVCESEDSVCELPILKTLPSLKENELIRLAPWPMVRSDALVRRASSLQKTLRAEQVSALVNAAVASTHGLSDGSQVKARQGDSEIEITLRVDDRIPDQCVMIPSGLSISAGFGSAEQAVTLEKSNA